MLRLDYPKLHGAIFSLPLFMAIIVLSDNSTRCCRCSFALAKITNDAVGEGLFEVTIITVRTRAKYS